MNTTILFNLFLLISAIVGFTICTYILSYNKKKNKSLLYLSLFILSISLNNFQSWLVIENIFANEQLADYIQFPWHFLAAPMFYMFLIHYLEIENKFINILKIVIPIFLIACCFQVGFILNSFDKNSFGELKLINEKYTSAEEMVSLISAISILAYSFYILFKKEKLFPKILAYDNLRWLYNFFILIIFIFIFWTIALLTKINFGFVGLEMAYYPLRIGTTTLIFWLGYQGTIQLRIVSERKVIREQINDSSFTFEPQEQPETIAQCYSEESIEIIAENEKYLEQFLNIDSLIKKDKKYLKPKYKLQDLSEETEIGTSTLSVIINSGAHKTFIDYINEMRVNQAKELLLNDKYSSYTITAVGLESGFNSKSTFYSVFKKHTGCTPLAYKKSCNC